MSAFIWTDESVSNLGVEFLLNVIDNMELHNQATVKFGTKGTGQRPNYEIRFGASGREAISARSKPHREDSIYKKYMDKNLSREFSLAEIKALYAQS